MRMNLNLTKLAAAIGLLCSASFAHAQVYELSYTDPYSAVKVQKPSVKFINPASGLTVTAISGLDRKVRLELIKGTTVVQSQTSPLITVANRIVASDSNEFYGTKFTVSDPGDGNYILRSTILDISGVVVATTDYPLMLDRVAPTSNPIAVQNSTGYSQVSSGPEWKLGTGGSETPDILITGLSDSSGIASGKFVVYRESGAVYKSVALSYNASSNSFAYPKNSTFPSSNLDELFKLQFEVTDLAGNVYKTPLQGARWDNITNPPGVFGVYNPNTSSTLAPGLTGFDPYVSGMTVMTNPIRLAYRLARTNYAGYVQSGINLTNGVGEVTKVGEDADYVYICENETINGTTWNKLPNTKGHVLVSDQSSMFLSRPCNVSDYGLIWAGVQKNVGPAGMAVVIIREDLITEDVLPGTPTMLTYKTHADAGSLYNTPNAYCIYVCGKVFKWLKKMGGLEVMKQRNEEKAKILYDYLDSSKLFKGTVVPEDRSLMNVPFVTGDKEMDAKFVKEATEAGLVNLKGHRTVGGMRASIYNAMPKAGVEALVAFMKKFEEENA